MIGGRENMAQVTSGQLHLLFLSIVLFTVASGLAFARLRVGQDRFTLAIRVTLSMGLLVGLLTLIWHSASRGRWVPIEDNFDALIWLGLLLAIFVLYTQRPFANAHPLRGLDGFLAPIIVVLLSGAAVFGRAKPHEYLGTTWSWAHRGSSYAGAGAGRGVRCRRDVPDRSEPSAEQIAGRRWRARLGSLERLEHVMLVAVTLGFALITIGAVTGLARIAQAAELGQGTRLGRHWFVNPKVLLVTGVWVIYAMVLHSPINPSVRGRRAAVLSVLGFVLMVGALVAVQFMPA